MAGENRTFTLVGKFDDRITPSLKKLNKEIAGLEKNLSKTFKGLNKDISSLSKNFDKAFQGNSKGISRMTSSLEDAGRAAGKVRDTVSQIGEGVKGLDGIGESLEAAARAAGRAQEEVSGIGVAAGKANKQADDLMTTLLKAEGLSKFGDAMSQGFGRGMNVVLGTARKGAGLVGKLFKESMEDELSDIKAAQGIEGSFGLAGFKGTFKESQKMYKQYDQVVSEMIRQSSAPTSKVVELQRYTLDTIGPLMLAAQGVKKGTAMKDIDPEKVKASAKQYGAFLEKAALFSQGTGSGTVRVAAGLEQLVTRGKIDTTIDFFADNVMLMKNLEKAGFAGRGQTSSAMTNATDAQRMAKMMEAFNNSMSGESTAAMAKSLTGSLQGLQDTIFNPSVGILGMSVTFSEEEQARANKAIEKIQNERIKNYQKELKSTNLSAKRQEELRLNIKQAEITRDSLIKNGANEISTPFKAFSYAFTGIVRALTNAINAIGPVWSQFAVAAIEVTNKVFGPLAETLENVASNMRSKDPSKRMGQAEGFGRIVGEIFKAVGDMMADLAKMITDPKGGLGKIESEFMKGFMGAFKEPGSLEKAKKGVADGITALIFKAFDFLSKVITWEPIRPLVLAGIAALFGPPLISAVISGITPLIISGLGKMLTGVFAGTGGTGLLASIPVAGWVAALAAAFIIFEGPLMAFAGWLQSTGQKLQESNNKLTATLGMWLEGMGQFWAGLTQFFNGLWEVVSGLISGDTDRVVNGIKKLFTGVANIFVGVAKGIVGQGGILEGVASNMMNVAIEIMRRIANKIDILGVIPDTPMTKPPAGGAGGRAGYETRNGVRGWRSTSGDWTPIAAEAKGSAHPFMGNLGQALNYEMKNKPSGSHLVVANSSETIIPAAKGLNGGMEGVIDAIWSSSSRMAQTLAKGFDTLNKSSAATRSSIEKSIALQAAGDAKIMNAIKASAAARGMAGGGGMGLGGGYGNKGVAIAGELGNYIKATGGAPGSIWEHPWHGGVKGKHAAGSYHYANRAIDIGAWADEQGGVISRIKAFNAKMGVKPVEFLHAGNDRNHQDHVHVAYALGSGNPAFFSSQSAATSWEKKMMPGGARVRSVTSNSSESMGGTSVGNINVTVNAGHISDPDQLATIVAQRLSTAIQEVRSANVLVG